MTPDEHIAMLARIADAAPMNSRAREKARAEWRAAIGARSLARWREMIEEVPEEARYAVARMVWFDLLSYGTPEREEDRVATQWADLLRLSDPDDGPMPAAEVVVSHLLRMGYMPSKAEEKRRNLLEANMSPPKLARPDATDE